MIVDEILEHKGHDVISIRPNARIREAVRLLNLENVGALVVSDDGLRLIGIISEREIIQSLAHRGATLLNEQVDTVMKRSIPTCTPNDRLKFVMFEMTQHRTRHMPVLDGSRLCGVVSIGDVVKHRLEDLQLKSAVLRDDCLAWRIKL